MSRRLLSMQGDRVLTALWDDGRIIECNVDERVPAFLGRIYLAKVDHIVPSISGAFLSAGDQKKRRECALDISYCTIKIGGKC